LYLDLNSELFAELNRERYDKLFLKLFEKLFAQLYEQFYRNKYLWLNSLSYLKLYRQMLPRGRSLGRPLHGRIVAERPANTICCGHPSPPDVGVGLLKQHHSLIGKQVFPAKMTLCKLRISRPGVA
jgi:hypothetical protein